MVILDFIAKLPTFQELNAHIYRVLRLKDSMKFHQIFMVKLPHDFNLVDQRFFSFFLTVGALLRKSLNCIFFVVLVLYHQVDRCEISFSNFFYWLEKLMKSFLVELVL